MQDPDGADIPSTYPCFDSRNRFSPTAPLNMAFLLFSLPSRVLRAKNATLLIVMIHGQQSYYAEKQLSFERSGMVKWVMSYA